MRVVVIHSASRSIRASDRSASDFSIRANAFCESAVSLLWFRDPLVQLSDLAVAVFGRRTAGDEHRSASRS